LRLNLVVSSTHSVAYDENDCEGASPEERSKELFVSRDYLPRSDFAEENENSYSTYTNIVDVKFAQIYS